jgi:hypothetical protein
MTVDVGLPKGCPGVSAAKTHSLRNRAARLLALASKERVNGQYAYADQLTRLATELVEAAMGIEARECSGTA